MIDLIKEIQSKIGSRLLINYDTRRSTWFRAGGNAKGYTVLNSLGDLKKVISYSDQINYFLGNVFLKKERFVNFLLTFF